MSKESDPHAPRTRPELSVNISIGKNRPRFANAAFLYTVLS